MREEELIFVGMVGSISNVLVITVYHMLSFNRSLCCIHLDMLNYYSLSP